MRFRFFPTFSSIWFSVSVFMCRSLIHLHLSFVQEYKNELTCILLHTDCQLNKYHILKLLSFFPLDDLRSLIKDRVNRGVCVHFWVFNSVPLIYLPVSLPITIQILPLLDEVSDGDFPSNGLWSWKIVFSLLVLFCYSRWICKWLYD